MEAEKRVFDPLGEPVKARIYIEDGQALTQISGLGNGFSNPLTLTELKRLAGMFDELSNQAWLMGERAADE